MITVVNKRTHRGASEYIGRPSPLGNPFAIGRDGSRDEVITKYRKWLANHWFAYSAGKPNAVQTELKRLITIYKIEGELTLSCWCAPAACHGDVLREAIIHEGT